MSDQTQVTVVDNPAEGRFEARLPDGSVVGGAYYEREPGVVIFTHTEVDPSMEGRGVGSQLAAGALDAVRAAGDKIVPLCPFIRAYVKRHPAYEDLVMRPRAGA